MWEDSSTAFFQLPTVLVAFTYPLLDCRIDKRVGTVIPFDPDRAILAGTHVKTNSVLVIYYVLLKPGFHLFPEFYDEIVMNRVIDQILTFIRIVNEIP